MNCMLYDQSSPVFTWLVEKEVSKKEATLQGEKEGEGVGQKGGQGEEPKCFGISPYPLTKCMPYELTVKTEVSKKTATLQGEKERKEGERVGWGWGGRAQCFGNSLYSVTKCMSHELSSAHTAHEKKEVSKKQQQHFRERKEGERVGGWGGRENHSALVFPLTL